MSPPSLLFISCLPVTSNRFCSSSPICRRVSTKPRITAALPPLNLSPTQQNILTAITLPTLPLVAYSEYVLLVSGCGLPPGPYGLVGASEGISYLIVAAVFLLSVYTKISTGKGLPDGPAKLLGAAEGIVYLLVVAGLGIAGYTIYKDGQLPGAIPTEGSRCYPIE